VAEPIAVLDLQWGLRKGAAGSLAFDFVSMRSLESGYLGPPIRYTFWNMRSIPSVEYQRRNLLTQKRSSFMFSHPLDECREKCTVEIETNREACA
jgi:hypothetical protein